MSAPRWTPRDWLAPWLLCGLALFSGALSSPRLWPLVAAFLAWVVVPWRPGPSRFRRGFGWTLGGLFAVIIAMTSLAPGVHWYQLLDMPAWAFLGLALYQMHTLGRGGSLAWLRLHSLLATLLPALQPHPATFAASLAWLLVVLPDLRRSALVSLGDRAHPWRAGWATRLALVAVLTIAAASSLARWRPSWQGSAWSPPQGMPGVVRDGTLGSLASAYDPAVLSEITVRAWGRPDPGPLVGTVFQVYGAGRWVPFPDGLRLLSERNVGEASVHCLTDDGMAPPTHWIRPSTDPADAPWLPEGSDCVGAVTDEVHGHPAGHFTVPELSASRGWYAFAQTRRDTARLPSDLQVPASLVPALDSALAEVRGQVRPTDPPDDLRPALERWFTTRFRYDLRPPLQPGVDPVASFLRSRHGFCEHFATLATLLLRRSGWPARYVKGWAEPEAAGPGLWVWRRGDAHAWVQVLAPGGTWTRFDPTPVSDRPDPPGPGWFGRTLEALTARAQSLWHGVRDGSWRERLDTLQQATESPWAWSLALVPALGLLVFARRRQRRGMNHAWGERLRRAEERLRRRSWVRAGGETVSAFLERVPAGTDPGAEAELAAYVAERFRRPMAPPQVSTKSRSRP